MCGLTGIVTANASTPDRSVLESMNCAQAHRGPDQDGVVVMPGAGLAHRRLTILDADHGRQPMQSADGRYTLVYNGEIYNYRALNAELAEQGYVVEGHCDTETLLHAWQHWGSDCVQRLRGMFAFAVWDAQEKRIFLARDRIGIKPLYYAISADGDLLFGSELKTLTAHPRLIRDIEPRALESYLALGYVPEPFAIYRNAFKLPAGHTLGWQAGQAEPQTRRYWDVNFAPRAHGDDAAVAAELHARLDESVRMRLIADVPLGAFLSGGVDSSAIVSLMACASREPVKTCAIGFDDGAFDESAHARTIAERFGTQHREHQIASEDFELIDTLIDVYDEPFADSSALPTYRVCELARQQVKVALSGDGGDENFAGYRRYRLHWAESRARARLPQALRKPLFGALGRLYPKMDWAPQFLRAKTTLQSLAMDTAEAYCHSVSMIAQPLRESLYSKRFKQSLAGYRTRDLFREHAAHAGTSHALSVAQYLDFKTYLPGDILTKVDRASMAHGLEVRVPLLDHEFVEWAAGLSPTQKLRSGEGKHALKEAFEPTLPHDILYRRKKGFSVPLDDWFRGPLREAGRSALTQGPLAESGIFEPAALTNLWQQHETGRRNHGSAIWSLLMLSRFLDRQSIADTPPARAPAQSAAHA